MGSASRYNGNPDFRFTENSGGGTFQLTILLKSLTSDDLKKEFVHPEYNRNISLDANIALYAWHSNHHLAHIKQALKAICSPGDREILQVNILVPHEKRPDRGHTLAVQGDRCSAGPAMRCKYILRIRANTHQHAIPCLCGIHTFLHSQERLCLRAWVAVAPVFGNVVSGTVCGYG